MANKTIYKSSAQTFIFRYLFPPIMLATGAVVVAVPLVVGGTVPPGFTYASAIAYAWVAIFLVQLPIYLRRIELNEVGMRVLSRKGSATIPYHLINQVSRFDFASPHMVTVRYVDPDSLQERKLSYMPSQRDQRFLRSDILTAYLIERAESSNPNFKPSSSIKNLGRLLLIGLPFFAAAIYFVMTSGG